PGYSPLNDETRAGAMRKGGSVKCDAADRPAERAQLGIDPGRQRVKHEPEITLAELALHDVGFSFLVNGAPILALAEPADGLREAPLKKTRSRPVEQLSGNLLELSPDYHRGTSGKYSRWPVRRRSMISRVATLRTGVCGSLSCIIRCDRCAEFSAKRA